MKFRLFNTIACIGSLATLCLQSSQAEAIFASVKSTGMAATAISYPIDSLCGAYNPAGETFVEDRIDVEAGWVHDTGDARVSGNSPLNPNPPPARLPPDNPITNGTFNGMRTKDAYPLSFGINKNWCICQDWELATALVVYNRNYQKTTYNQFLPLYGTTHAGLEYLNETVSPIFAIKWCNSHSLGISINYQLERIKVNGLQNFDHPPTLLNPTGSVAPGHVTNRGYDYAQGWGFTIGYLGRFTDCLAVGVTYQPKTTMSKMSKYKGFLSQRGRLDIPEKIGAGISYKVMPCVTLAFDVEHIRWTQIKALSNPLLPSSDAQIPNLLGANDGPGFGFINQWFYRVGAEWIIDESWTARIGFRHANTPIKKSQTAVNVLTLDTVEDFITVGGTYNINCNSEISIVYAYGFEKKVNGKNSNPALFGGGETDLKEQKYALGVALGWKF